MRTGRLTPLLLAAGLLLAACGDEGVVDEAPAEEAVTEQETDTDEPDDPEGDADSDQGEASDEEAAADAPATVALDGTELTPLPDTLQCVAFPDGTDRVVLEVADPAAGADDPEARMSLTLERDEDGSRVRIATGLDLPEEINGEWEAGPEDAEQAEIDPEGRTTVTELPLELRTLNYDGDPQPQERAISIDIDCS